METIVQTRDELLARITAQGSAIGVLCQEHEIRRLALFGSVLGPDFTPESDVDVLVEFEPGRTPGFLGMAHIENRLSDLLGRQVDLRTAAELSRLFRAEVLEACETCYAA